MRKDTHKVLGVGYKDRSQEGGNLHGSENSLIKELKTLPLLACIQQSATLVFAGVTR